MLRTNSKQVKEAIRAYIMQEAVDVDNGYIPFEDLKTAAEAIKADVIRVMQGDYYNRLHNLSGWSFKDFNYWVHGLPGLLDLPFIYKQPAAVDILGDILQETPAERARYTETQADEMLCRLIFRELDKAANNK
jgi:hypothetical protein